MTGLASVGYTIYNKDGTVFQARKTALITEVPAGSGIYGAPETDASLAGRMVTWDTGGTSPLYATESFPEDLTGYTPGAKLALSIKALAKRAYRLYSKGDEGLYEMFLQYGWRDMLLRVGESVSDEEQFPLTAGTVYYNLPPNFRRMKQVKLIDNASSPAVVTVLPLTTEQEALESGTATNPPQYYFYRDRNTIGFSPIPDDNYMEVNLYYDAGADADLAIDEELPIDHLYERGLLAYAISQMASVENDQTKAAVEFSIYEKALASWANDNIQRMERVTQAQPYWAFQRTASIDEALEE